MRAFRPVFYTLGYLWSILTTVPGLLLFILALLCGAIEHDFFYGPAVVVRLRGKFSDWMGREKNGHFMYAHTVGPFCFFYRDPEPQTVLHEATHVRQQMLFGPAMPLVYALSYLYGLAKYRDTFKAYRQVIWERLARKAAGEE